VIVWDRRTGEPAGPCVIWQCRRTAGFCDELRRRGLEAAIRKRTGLPVDPLFSASKIRWLLSSIPDGMDRAAAGDLRVGTVDSWLLWNFIGAKETPHGCQQRLTHAIAGPGELFVGSGTARNLRDSRGMPA